MRNPIFIIVLLFFISANSQQQLTAEQWREDLKFLQHTVHEDYPFLFKKITAEEFDTNLESLYNKIPELENHEIVTGIAKLVSSFKYGHTELGWRDENVEIHQLPLNFYQFNDGIFVQAVHEDYKNVLGTKLIAVEGMPVEDVLKAIYPVVPAENSQYFKAHGINYMNVPEILHAQGITNKLKTEIEFTFEKDGNQFKQKIKALGKGEKVHQRYGFIPEHDKWLDARNKGETPLYLKNLADKIYYFEYLPEHKTVYVRHSSIRDDENEPIPEFYNRLFRFIDENDVEKLVLDVRLNGGGNNYKNKPIIQEVLKSEKINQPGKFFVILGRRTFSACQNLVNELDNYTNAIFIGEPTAENINFYGDTNEVELPNSKIPVYLSFAWWQDKPQWENAEWLGPHIAVNMSYEDYRQNRDPVLETALNFSDEDFILDPMEYLTNLFMAGEMEKVQSEAIRMVNDPKYEFFDFEEEFNTAGYNLLSSNRVEEAVYVFTMNMQLFPESANVWDSLAEAHLKAGDRNKAIEYYRKAIQLDPNGNVGMHAKNRLKDIETGSQD